MPKQKFEKKVFMDGQGAFIRMLIGDISEELKSVRVRYGKVLKLLFQVSLPTCNPVIITTQYGIVLFANGSALKLLNSKLNDLLDHEVFSIPSLKEYSRQVIKRMPPRLSKAKRLWVHLVDGHSILMEVSQLELAGVIYYIGECTNKVGSSEQLKTTQLFNSTKNKDN